MSSNSSNKESRGGEFAEKVVKVRRCATVVKGGRRFSFAGLVVVGNGRGKVGCGYGKANEVPPAVEKAIKDGMKNLIEVFGHDSASGRRYQRHLKSDSAAGKSWNGYYCRCRRPGCVRVGRHPRRIDQGTRFNQSSQSRQGSAQRSQAITNPR